MGQPGQGNRGRCLGAPGGGGVFRSIKAFIQRRPTPRALPLSLPVIDLHKLEFCLSTSEVVLWKT